MCVPTLPRARIGPSRHSCTFYKADFCSHHTCFITWGAHLGSAGQGTDSPYSLMLPTPTPCFQTSPAGHSPPLGVHSPSSVSSCPLPLQSPSPPVHSPFKIQL